MHDETLVVFAALVAFFAILEAVGRIMRRLRSREDKPNLAKQKRRVNVGHTKFY